MMPPRRCGRRCATYCLGGAGREDSSKPRVAKKAMKQRSGSAAHDDGTERPTGAAARRGAEADSAAAADAPGSGGKAQHTKGAAALNGAAASRYQVMEPPSPPPGPAAPDGFEMKQFFDVYAAGPAAHYYYGAAAPVSQGIGYGAPPPGLSPAGGRSAAGIGYGPHMVQPYWVGARRARNLLVHAAGGGLCFVDRTRSRSRRTLSARPSSRPQDGVYGPPHPGQPGDGRGQPWIAQRGDPRHQLGYTDQPSADSRTPDGQRRWPLRPELCPPPPPAARRQLYYTAGYYDPRLLPAPQAHDDYQRTPTAYLALPPPPPGSPAAPQAAMRSPYDDEGAALTQHARVASPDGLYLHFADGRGTPAAGPPRSAATEPGSSVPQGATPLQWETQPSAGGAGRKTRAQQLLEFAVAQSREEAAEEQIHMALPVHTPQPDKMQLYGSSPNQYGSSPQRAGAAPHESGAVARGTEYGRFASSPSAGDPNACARPVDGSAGQRGAEAAASPQPPRLFSSGAMAVAAARHAGMRVAMANHNLAHPQTETREDRQFYYY